MKLKRILLVTAVALSSTVAMATSDNLIQGAPAYVKGSTPTIPEGFGTSTAASQVFDDATNGDVTSNDNIYTHSFTGAVAGAAFDFKVADNGYSPVNTPANGSDNLKGVVPVSGNFKVFVKTTAFGDGYVPEVTLGSPTADGVVWYDGYAAFIATKTLKAVGSFQSELGGSDWDAAGAGVNITDAGNTTLGDNVYAGSVTGLPAGSYSYKIVTNNAFSPTEPGSFGDSGYSPGGGNLTFGVIAPTDTITITMDITTARIKTTNDNPLANPGPPFYAQSTAWSTGYTAAEQLHDDGTLGDATSGDNIYSRTFVVNTPGVYGVRVRQGIGPSYPSANDYPIGIGFAPQTILVVLDRNTYADGYEPAGNFMVALVNSPRNGANSWERIAPVGALATPFGGSDWTPDAINVNMTDDAAAPDGIALDGIWSRSYAEIGAGTFGFKIVLNRTGTGLTGYAIQGGGDVDGLSVTNVADNSFTTDAVGNTVIAFDSVTGRVRVAPAYAAPTRPAAYFAGYTDVADWTMY